MSQAAALAAGQDAVTPAGRSPRRRGRSLWEPSALLFVGPSVLLALAFLILPMLGTFFYSTQKVSPLTGDTTPLGLENFRTMLGDDTFVRALLNTALFTVITVPLSMALGLALAVLMNSVLPGRKIWRTVVYLPLVISGVSVGLIGTFLYNEVIGVVNKLLVALGASSGIPWQSNGAWAFISVVLVTLWIRVGFSMIIYLASLQAVPPDLYEAAALDGANGWQRFRNVTVPLVGPATFFLIIMNVIYSFQVFDTIFVLTNGGPGNSTEVLGTWAYKVAFGPTRDQGYGAAIGVVIFVLTLVFTIVQWRANRSRDEVA
ncbi:carbohydrate ABC transporter permease [Microlunatus antarcticus]|uniref:ABC-type sugar transport system permease subunit n=1 Tax=Microlunatus antarcticus TaxID=53388 RepID=A0A7W5P5S8_9ACTN|nr:ABC-type sugar transport system permease subunit [Microlunatus antarcticus]